MTAAERLHAAALPPSSETVRESDLPTVLLPGEAERYRTIFALQQDGRWAAADAEIATLDDDLLRGHLLAQRYLHRAYRSSFAELLQWLEHYADLPQAEAIHALALKRRMPGSGKLPAPQASPIALRGIVDDPADLRPPGRAAAGPDQARVKLEIRGLSRSDPAMAERVLREAEAAHLLGDSDYDEARADVAEGYLFFGESQKALLLAATARTAAYRPLAHWDAGLAAWRLGRLGEARSHFEAVARMPELSHWTLSAAAFWAARIHAKTHRGDLVNYWLGIAAEHPRSFYGLLARRLLGQDDAFDFEPEIFTDIDLNALTGIPAARRALALMQVGRGEAAELELRALADGAPFTLYPGLLALADRAGMPALSVELASMLSQIDGRRHDHALYPVPRWQPAGGYTLDRALLFALIRQESQFQPDAESHAGAVGLMQLMPSTAVAMAERAGLALGKPGKNGGGLADPATNLALGQQFLASLIEHPQIKGNLILLAAAYNSGPGHLTRWRAQSDHDRDPLLFLESLPSRETRIFVERVLANYWVYRQRLGQPTADLDLLAGGEWPVYVALDAMPSQVTRHVAAR